MTTTNNTAEQVFAQAMTDARFFSLMCCLQEADFCALLNRVRAVDVDLDDAISILEKSARLQFLKQLDAMGWSEEGWYVSLGQPMPRRSPQ